MFPEAIVNDAIQALDGSGRRDIAIRFFFLTISGELPIDTL